ncbi:hypothetical protein [Nonomuraea sp. NPDC049625]|uniref:hypothetical protein n=1 Tax=Nonomuraea sp. NPDC049625 TaxID=3155775 RepID=UPI003443D583
MRRVTHWHRPLVLMVATMLVVALASLIGLVVEQRVLLGVPIWMKPLNPIHPVIFIDLLGFFEVGPVLGDARDVERHRPAVADDAELDGAGAGPAPRAWSWSGRTGCWAG